MALCEFDLIRTHFHSAATARDDVRLGIGDDCALLRVPGDRELAVSIDTLVSGVHFFPDTDPYALGHKALAVNLSDLAAMGAEPAWVTLALALPESDSEWLEGFSSGFLSLARRHGVQLVGGDTTRGPLTITVQAHGFVAPGRALRRDAARVRDWIYVTGPLGDAGLALRMLLEGHAGELPEALRRRLERPTPRLAEGRAAVGLAHAAIDLSDGLLADLGHVCRESGVGARLDLHRLPLSEPVARQVRAAAAWDLPLASGDDYELCLTVAPEHGRALEGRFRELDAPLYRIGVVEAGSGIRCQLPDGGLLGPLSGGYEHFRNG